MALPNPALTFQQTAITVCASTAKTDVITAIEASINGLTGDQAWTAGTIDGDAAATPATLIAAPSGSPISTFRAIFGFSDATNPLAAEIKSPDTRVTDFGWISIGPDGRTGSTNWYAPDPYGVGNRNSEFWKAANLNTVEQVWCIASEETLTIVMRGATDGKIHMVHFGAIVDPCDTDSMEADERIYGMCTTNINTLSTTWSKDLGAGNPFANNSSNGQSHFGVFNPVSPAAWIACQINMLADDGTTTTASSLGGNKYLAPTYVWQQFSTAKEFSYAVGRFRGIFLLRARPLSHDSAGLGACGSWVPCVSSDLGVANDAFIWGNE